MPTKTVRMAVLTSGIDSAISGMSKLGASKDKLTGDAVVRVNLIGGDITEEKLAALEAEIKAITDKGATVRVNMSGTTGDLTKITAESDALAASGARVSTTLEDEGAKAGGFGSKLNGLLLPALVGIGAVLGIGIYKASGFNAAMERIHTQAGLTQAQLNTMTPQILALAGQIGENPDSLAEAFYHVASSMASIGGTGPQMLLAVKIAAEGARVGGANLVDVTNALGAAIASGIPGVQNYQSAMGALNATVGAGDMTMQDLSDALGTGFLSNVKIYGSTLNDVGAILATFGDNNIRGAMAGTQLRVSVQSIAVQAKTAGPALKELGLSIGELGKYQSLHGTVATINLLVQRMKAAGITSTETGAIVTELFGKKAGAGIAVLIDQVARLDSKQKVLTDGAKSFGAAWDATNKTSAQQFADLKAGADALVISLGIKLLPAALAVMKGLNSFMQVLQRNAAVAGILGGIIGTVLAGFALKKLEDGVKGAAEGFEVLWKSGKKVVVFATEMVSKFLALFAAQEVETVATEEATVAQEGLNLAFLANPIGLIIIGIVALVAGFVMLWEHSAAFRDFWIAVWHDILVAVDFAFNWVKHNWPLLIGILTGPIGIAVALIVTHWQQVTRLFADFAGPVIQEFDKVKNYIATTFSRVWDDLAGPAIREFDKIKTFVSSSFDSWWKTNGDTIKQIWHDLWAGMTAVLHSTWDVVVNVAKAGWDILRTAFHVGSAIVQDEWRILWAGISAVFHAVWDVVAALVKFDWEVLKVAFSVGSTVVLGTWRVLWLVATTLFRAAWDVITASARVGWAILTAIFQVAGDVLVGVWKIGWAIVVDALKVTWAAVKLILKVGWDVLVGIFTVGIDLVTGKWGRAWAEVKLVASQVWNAIKAFFTTWWSALTGVFNTSLAVVEGVLKNAWNSVYAAVKSSWNTIVGFFKGIGGLITGAIGDLSRLLYNIGASIINGLWNGLKAMWNSGPASWLKSLGGIISSLKGPLDHDAQLLVPHGVAIMSGFLQGLTTGWKPGKGFLSAIGASIPGLLTSAGAAIGAKVQNAVSAVSGGNAAQAVPDSGSVIVNVYAHPSNSPDEVAREVWQQLRVLKKHMGNKPLGLS
jgi:TP901 family phage tail tape measure protein